MAPINPPPAPPALKQIDPSSQNFVKPLKRIHTHLDLTQFHNSPGYQLITAFIIHLNASVSPLDPVTEELRSPEDFFTSSSTVTVSAAVERIVKLIANLRDLIEKAPPLTTPQRFGNLAFRNWFQLAEAHVKEHAAEYLPEKLLPAKEELLDYLVRGLGSSERIDYGTGHELSFAAFLAGIWVLGGFQPGDERALVFKVFDAYFKLVRTLVTTYSLEPAGSHGVWGLDDHAFLPYIFGSAQLTTFRPKSDSQATQEAPAAAADLPKPDEVTKKNVVDREREKNLYFDAIGFIYDVKKGPFWEHSPVLYDISGVQKGWGKISEGLLKMYEKEVLGKFPVVQHFHFGSIFRWSADPEDLHKALAEHASKPHPVHSPSPSANVTTKAPWANTAVSPEDTVHTRAPWASRGSADLSNAPFKAPQPPTYPTSAGTTTLPPGQLEGVDTKAPWAVGNRRSKQELDPSANSKENMEDLFPLKTEAPLGPRRTSSPDSALAAQEKGPRRDSSIAGTGGVRVAETGDLSAGRSRQNSVATQKE